MEKYIQEYLSTYYKIDYSQLGNAGIYDINKNPKQRAPNRSNEVIKEISQVFFISEENAKNQIIIWATLVDPDVDLEFYWKEVIDIIFPAINRIHPITISMDLVSVQPMAAPNSGLVYANYLPEETSPVISGNIRKLWENQRNQIIGVSSRGIGELDHPTDAADAIWNSILINYSGRT